MAARAGPILSVVIIVTTNSLKNTPETRAGILVPELALNEAVSLRQIIGEACDQMPASAFCVARDMEAIR